MAEEDRQRAAHASHVARASHAAGGGTAKGARPQAPRVGIVARAAANPKAWDAWLEEEDRMSHPLYVNMKFPEPGPGTEYPKWVVGDGTKPEHRLANDKDEEAAILAEMNPEPEPEPDKKTKA